MQHNASAETGERAGQVASAMQQRCLGVRVGRLHRLVARRFEQALRPTGLSISQMEILSALVVAAAPVRPGDLAGWLAIERSTMSRNLTLMESRGLVLTTETSPTGRSQKVTISAAGTAALADAESAWTQAQDAVSRTLGPDAVPVLDAWLTAMD